jgi:hypothetical protein
MRNDFTLGIQGTVEPNITFLTNSNKEAMRIDKNGVKVNPDFPMDEAAQYVIKALDEHIKGLINAERERFASECIDLVAMCGGPVELEAAIRARSKS